MGFFYIFVISTICALSLLSTGRIFNKLIIKNIEVNFFENIIYGFILFSFLSLTLNFFISLNQNLNLIILIASLLIYFFNSKNNYKKDLIYVLIISFFSVVVMSFENINRPDGGLYHFPFINILNENKLIVGLSNLHFRYGHISIIQYFSSIYNNILFTDNGILVPSSIIFFSLLGYLLCEIFRKDSDIIYKFLSLMFSLYILLNMNRYSSWGNDDFASIIFFIIIIESYKYFQKKSQNSFTKIILLCTICFLIKTFYLIIFLLPLSLLLISFKKIKLKEYFSINLFFCFVFIVLWLIRGYLTTSCLIFPVNFTCFANFDWSLNEEYITRVSHISEAWSKDWPNYNLKNQYNYNYYISNFNWISTWINNHFLIISKNLVLFLLLIFFVKSQIKISLNVLQKKFVNLISIVLFILAAIWFLKFPIFRYGEGIVITLFLFLSFYLKFSIFSLDFKKISLILIVVFGSGIFLKNAVKFYENYNKFYLDYPWPKKNTFTQNNKKNEYIEYKQDGKVIYVEPKIASNLCMYGRSPCAAIEANKYFFGIKNNISIIKDQFLFFESFKIVLN